MKPGEWIFGRGWDQNLWPDKQFPTHEALTAAFPNNPVPFSGASNMPAGTTFSLSTVGATPSGYVLHLTAVDRAIVNSGSIGQWTQLPLGFCVEQP